MTKRENVKGNFYILPKSDSRHERLFFATAEQSAKSYAQRRGVGGSMT